MNKYEFSHLNTFFFPLALSFFLVALGLTIFFLIPHYFVGKIYPQTFVFNQNFGFQRKEIVYAFINKRLSTLSQSPFSILKGDRIASTTLNDLGIYIEESDLRQKIDQLSHNLPSRWKFYRSSLKKKQLILEPKVDLSLAQNTLLKIFPEMKRPIPAAFIIDNSQKLTIKPEEIGQQIDLPQFFQDVTENINSGKMINIKLKEHPLMPAVTTQLLNQYHAVLEKKLQQKINLFYKNKSYDLPLMENLNWLYIDFEPSYFSEIFEKELPLELIEMNQSIFDLGLENVPLLYKPHIRLNEKNMRNFLDQTLKKDIEFPTTDVKIYYDSDDRIQFEGTGRDGRALKEKQLIKNLELALNEGISTFQIPTKILKAKVNADEKLLKLGIKNLIATGYSNFSGSPANRIHNIKIGMNKYASLLIKPGEIFSFNQNLGEVDAETGYLKELVIKKGKTTPEYGGGVCQVSSTVFRAAFFGGLPIVERKNHSFAVRYYAQPDNKYGLDATIYLGSTDLRFLNDTPGYILIQSYVAGNDAYIKLYGTDDERIVLTDGPYVSNKKAAPPPIIEYSEELPPGKTKKEENAIAGFDAMWYRTVIQGDTPKTENFFSRYRPWAERVVVGADKAEKNQKKES